MALVCCEIAVERHVGQLETHYTPFGATYVQKGKDLTAVQRVIGTGGPLVHSRAAHHILSGSVFDTTRPQLLKPREPEMLLDKQYLFAAMGLLSERYPRTALELMKKHVAPC
jgi:uncharacterized protein (TIGR01319 family)